MYWSLLCEENKFQVHKYKNFGAYFNENVLLHKNYKLQLLSFDKDGETLIFAYILTLKSN
jgi:hypothetical protein